MMWLNCSRTKVDPAYVGEVVKILSGEASLAPILAARGFFGLYLVESTEAPGDLVSITVWESAEEGQAYLASPECRGVIEGIQEYLVRPLERNYYAVHIVISTQKENQYVAQYDLSDCSAGKCRQSDRNSEPGGEPTTLPGCAGFPLTVRG